MREEEPFPPRGSPSPSLAACKIRHRNIPGWGDLSPRSAAFSHFSWFPSRGIKAPCAGGRPRPSRAVMGADSSGGQRAAAWAGGALRSRPPDSAGPGSPPEVKHEPLPSLTFPAFQTPLSALCGAGEQSRGTPQVLLESQIPRQCWRHHPSAGGSHAEGRGMHGKDGSWGRGLGGTSHIPAPCSSSGMPLSPQGGNTKADGRWSSRVAKAGKDQWDAPGGRGCWNPRCSPQGCQEGSLW